MDIYKQESINSSKLAVLVLAIPASHRMDASWKEAWTHSVKNICKMQVAPCDWCWESVWCQCSNSWFWSAERIRAATCTSESVGQSQWVGVNMQFTHLSKQGMALGNDIPVLTKQVRVSYHVSKISLSSESFTPLADIKYISNEKTEISFTNMWNLSRFSKIHWELIDRFSSKDFRGSRIFSCQTNRQVGVTLSVKTNFGLGESIGLVLFRSVADAETWSHPKLTQWGNIWSVTSCNNHDLNAKLSRTWSEA